MLHFFVSIACILPAGTLLLLSRLSCFCPQRIYHLKTHHIVYLLHILFTVPRPPLESECHKGRDLAGFILDISQISRMVPGMCKVLNKYLPNVQRDLPVMPEFSSICGPESGKIFSRLSCSFRGGNGNSLQYPCLENPMD